MRIYLVLCHGRYSTGGSRSYYTQTRDGGAAGILFKYRPIREMHEREDLLFRDGGDAPILPTLKTSEMQGVGRSLQLPPVFERR